jgi:hypothetical protein
LGYSNLALTELIEVTEELLDSDSLHNDLCLEALFHIRGIVSDMDSRLKIAVFQNVDVSCGAGIEEVAGCDCGTRGIGRARLGEGLGTLCSLGSQLREHILGAVNVCAKSEVIDFSFIILVQVLSDDEVINLV